jgi:hypothetical protein
MRIALVMACAGLLLPGLAPGQKLELKLDSVAAQASEKAEVDLDEAALGAALNAAPPEALQSIPMIGKLNLKGNVKDLLAGIKGVHVRNYEFAKPGAYSDKDLEPLRSQVGSGSGWSRIINVKDKDESVEIYLMLQGDELRGFLMMACEPKELAVVHIVGSVPAEAIKELVSSNIQYQLGK